MNLHWIVDDFRTLIAQLKRGQTWFVIGLLTVFAALTYFVSTFAFRTDNLLVFLHRTAGACRTMSNGAIIFLFCGMIFFMLTALLTLGEFQRYFEFKQHHAHVQARHALIGGCIWGAISIGISVSALIFFNYYCR